MNCLECEELLQQKLDGVAGVDQAVLDQHMSHCATCREQHAAAIRLLEGLKDLPAPKARPIHAQAIVAEVLRERKDRNRQWRRRVLVTTALAASVAVIALFATLWIPHAPQEGKLLVLERPKIEVKIPPEVDKTPEPRSPLSPLVDRWVDTTRDHAKVVLVATNLNAVENLAGVDRLPPLDPSIREASQEVTDGVRRVTRNARRAIDFFARELPMPELADHKN